MIRYNPENYAAGIHALQLAAAHMMRPDAIDYSNPGPTFLPYIAAAQDLVDAGGILTGMDFKYDPVKSAAAVRRVLATRQRLITEGLISKLDPGVFTSWSHYTTQCLVELQDSIDAQTVPAVEEPSVVDSETPPAGPVPPFTTAEIRWLDERYTRK